MIFDLRKGIVDFWPKLPLNPFPAAQSIAMLAAVCALVVAYQCRGFFGNCAHFGPAFTAHIQNWPHMQRTDRCMGIPGAFAAMFSEHFRQRGGVLSEMLQRHGAVFNKTHWLAVTLEAHHDVEAGLTHFPQVFLWCVINHFDH